MPYGNPFFFQKGFLMLFVVFLGTNVTTATVQQRFGNGSTTVGGHFCNGSMKCCNGSATVQQRSLQRLGEGFKASWGSTKLFKPRFWGVLV